MASSKTFRIENNSEVSADITAISITPDDVGFSLGTAVSLPYEIRPQNYLEFDILAERVNYGTATATLLIENDTPDPVFTAGLAAMYPTPITPGDIPGVQIWLDASQIVGKTDGQTMNSGDWDSLGAVAASMNCFGLSNPTYQTNEQNGQPCVRFARSQSQSMVGDITYAATYHIFVVARVPGGNFVGNYSILQNATTAKAKFTEVSGTTHWNTSNWDVNNIYRKNGTDFPSGEAAPGSTQIYEIQMNAGTGGLGDLILANDSAGISWSDVDIFEVATYAQVLTEEQRLGLVDGFNEKYAIF